MWQYETSVVWKEGKRGEIHSGGKHPIEAATPPEFGGPQNYWSPEDLLTGSVATCIMTSAIFFLERAGVEINAYISNATGRMEKGAKGLEMTGIDVEVSVTVDDASKEDAVRTALERAEQTCPISNALSFPVELEVQVNIA